MGRTNRRDNLDEDTLQRLVLRIGALETKVDAVLLYQKKGYGNRKYLIGQIKRLRVEKSALLKYMRELEGFLKVQREGDKDT